MNPSDTNFPAPERTHLRLGFVALSDAAPLAVAALRDLGARHGITIELCRQPSWAAVRDKLLSGEIDAAHALYGLVYGVQLGIGGPQADMAVLMVLNRNGQAITLSRPLADAMERGASVKEALHSLGRTPVIAQTFPTGTHAMWLYYWLAAHGEHPLRDVESIVIPPPRMADALVEGALDGFCAGEPWHAVAEARGAGKTVAYTSEIRRRCSRAGAISPRFIRRRRARSCARCSMPAHGSTRARIARRSRRRCRRPRCSACRAR
jgi:nitrate/nitrite transport system substrate-binding protein